MPPLPSGHPVLNGKYHRFGPQKKGWYILREMTLKSGRSVITGAFGLFQGESRNTVSVTVDQEAMTEADREEYVSKMRAAEQAEDEQRKHDAHLAANRAKDQWNKAAGLPLVHPYLERKQVEGEGVRVSEGGLLIIPMMRDGQMVGVQKIDREGGKTYNKGMDKIGAAHTLGELVDAPFIGLGEGYATCWSARHSVAPAMDLPVSVAFDAGSILPVAIRLRKEHPQAHLLFLADDDYQLAERFNERLREEFKVSVSVPIDGQTHTVCADDGEDVQITATWRQDAQGIEYLDTDVRKGRLIRMNPYKNAGVAACHLAAKKVGNASVVRPMFSNRDGRKLTDFNDLWCEEGREQVAAQIGSAILAAQQPNIASPTPSPAPSASAAAPSDDDQPMVGESPPPPSDKSPASRSSDGAEGEDPMLAAVMQARYDELGDPPGDPAAPSAGGEGDAPKGRKEKPKKVYGREHWDQVEYVLRNFILIYGEDLVWDVSQRMLMKISSMRTIVQNSDVMKFWGGDARRWVLKKNIVFDPRDMPSPATSGETATVNLFGGWKMKSKRGKCIKIQTLLHHLCDGNEDLTQWVERWLAYPLRNRGAKMETSIIMHGDEGSGKNFFFEKVIKKIYGEYGYVIGNAQLESQFNDWASMKLFMVADEVVTRSELKHMKGKLKYLVSGDSIIINPKGLPEHHEANHMNFVFLSNELQPLALDKTDRRYLVIWTPPALSREFYVEVAKEIEVGGIEAFYHYLLHEVDMGDFDEHTKPLYTDAKDDLIEKSLTPAERFYRDWSRGFLPLPFITCGATQLYDAYKVWCEKSGEPRYISQTMFSPTVERYAGDAIEKRVIKYDLGEKVKQRNVFLVGKQPEGKALSDWVSDASNMFENELRSYRSRATANVEG